MYVILANFCSVKYVNNANTRAYKLMSTHYIEKENSEDTLNHSHKSVEFRVYSVITWVSSS